VRRFDHLVERAPFARFISSMTFACLEPARI
jgi:hypothetical protein